MYCFRENSNFPFSNQKIITLMGSESCNENETVKNSTNSQIQGTPENLIAMIQGKFQRQFDDLKSNIDKNKQCSNN
jgi:hypothetical protein